MGYRFQQRNAVIHRSMVEKMPETEGYGTIEKEGNKFLTVFELETFSDKTPQPPKVQWWDCESGWADQIFIYPACGVGPGQIRWAKDPQMCLYRQVTNQKLVLGQCEWTQPFIFKIAQEYQDKNSPNPLEGRLKVGITDLEDKKLTDKEKEEKKDYHAHCFDTSDSLTIGNEDKAGSEGTFAASKVVTKIEDCPKLTFKGLWNSAT